MLKCDISKNCSKTFEIPFVTTSVQITMSTRLSDLKIMVRLVAEVRSSRVTHMSVENIRKACITFIKRQQNQNNENSLMVQNVLGNETPESFFDTQLNVGECKLQCSNGRNSVRRSIFDAFFKRAIQKIDIDKGAYLFLVYLKVYELKKKLNGHENDMERMEHIIYEWLKNTEVVRQPVYKLQIREWISSHRHHVGEGCISKLCQTVVRCYFTDCSFFGSSEWRNRQLQMQTDRQTINSAPSMPQASASSSSRRKRLLETLECLNLYDDVIKSARYMGFSTHQKNKFKKCFMQVDYMNRKRLLVNGELSSMN